MPTLYLDCIHRFWSDYLTEYDVEYPLTIKSVTNTVCHINVTGFSTN